MVSFLGFRPEEGRPIYLEIVRFVESGVAAGTIRDGDELPSRRVLSASLGVNPNTIQKACRILEDEGVIRSHTGAKSLVNAGPELADRLRRKLLREGAAAIVTKMKALGFSRDEALALVGRLWDGPTEGGEAE